MDGNTYGVWLGVGDMGGDTGSVRSATGDMKGDSVNVRSAGKAFNEALNEVMSGDVIGVG